MKTKYNNNPYMKVLSHNMKYLREAYKLSQRQLSEAIGVSQGTISFYEQGRSTPELSTLIDFGKYFCVSLDALIHEELSDDNIFRFATDISQIPESSRRLTGFYNIEQILKRFSNKAFYLYYCGTDSSKERVIDEGVLTTGAICSPKAVNVEAAFGKHNYSGKWTITGHSFMYISLENELRNENCMVVIPYAYSAKPYIGGMGCALSISTGASPTPCYQQIMISEEKIDENQLCEEDFIKRFLVSESAYHSHFDVNNDRYAYQDIKQLKYLIEKQLRE